MHNQRAQSQTKRFSFTRHMHSIRWVGYTIESDVREKYFFFTSFKKMVDPNNGDDCGIIWSHQRRVSFNHTPIYSFPAVTNSRLQPLHVIRFLSEWPMTPTTNTAPLSSFHPHHMPINDPPMSETQHNTILLFFKTITILLFFFFLFSLSIWSLTSQVITTATHDIQTSMNVFHVFPIPFVWNVGFSSLFDVKGIDY